MTVFSTVARCRDWSRGSLQTLLLAVEGRGASTTGLYSSGPATNSTTAAVARIASLLIWRRGACWSSTSRGSHALRWQSQDEDTSCRYFCVDCWCLENKVLYIINISTILVSYYLQIAHGTPRRIPDRPHTKRKYSSCSSRPKSGTLQTLSTIFLKNALNIKKSIILEHILTYQIRKSPHKRMLAKKFTSFPVFISKIWNRQINLNARRQNPLTEIKAW